MKKVRFKLIAALSFASMMMVPTFAKDATTIKILHTNDTHANVKDDGKSSIGFAKFASYVEEERAKEDNLLVLDAGDMFQGLPFANLEQGKSIIDIANAVGYDAMTLGNHEFDFGSDNLFNNILSKLNYPAIAANVYKGDKKALDTYIVKEIDGVKVGIFGMATEETAFKSHPDNTVGYTFADMIKEAQSAVNDLKEKEGADVVIMLSHLGLYEGDYTSDLVAKQVKGIDVIVDGHSHTALSEGLMVGDTLIVSTGSSFSNVGEVELTVEDGKVVSKQAELLGYAAFSEVKPDEQILAAIAKTEAEQKPILEKVVGKALVDLVGERTLVRTGETNLGQLAADSLIDLTHAQVAITNGGGIRASIKAGDITMNDMITVFPFGNTVMVKEIKGSDIKAALEHGVSEYPNEKGAFPHTAGMTFTLNAYKEAGSRISDLKIDGQPVDMNKTYTVATNDFMAAGGDGYDMFKPYPIKAEYNTIMDTLLSYVEKLGTIKGEFAPRMTVVKEAPAGADKVEEDKEETASAKIIVSLLDKKITKNGQAAAVEAFPYIEGGRVMAGLRDTGNLLEVELEWDNASKTATVKGQAVTFTAGQDYAVVAGKKVALGVTTKIVNDRVQIPMAQVARLLDRAVSYDNNAKVVTIA